MDILKFATFQINVRNLPQKVGTDKKSPIIAKVKKAAQFLFSPSQFSCSTLGNSKFEFPS